MSARPDAIARPVLITGGAGFIATNLAARLLDAGRTVRLYDNLSRAGVGDNAAWLLARYGNRVELVTGDVRDVPRLRAAAAGVRQIYHLAAQVAVTTSLTDPFTDFEVNARGTLNVLEVARTLDPVPSLVFTSTNKVYGALHDLPLAQAVTRYAPVDRGVERYGIDESRMLAFHSPYGCSKGAADQYVLDYARTFGMPAVVLRMSCIYGPHQCGTEDQGWVAHFVGRALADGHVTIYGDGRQVRDVLFVDDLVDALMVAQARARDLAGQAFNIGGGATRSVSLLELMELLAACLRRRLRYERAPWRAADQRYYVSDTRRFQSATGWTPATSVEDGLRALAAWWATAHLDPAAVKVS